jgi:hypothetical protein
MKKLIIITLATLFSISAYSQQYFKGYRCTQDCAGHIAGYKWAARKGITDPSECGGNSQLFYEGCLAYAEGK